MRSLGLELGIFIDVIVYGCYWCIDFGYFEDLGWDMDLFFV